MAEFLPRLLFNTGAYARIKRMAGRPHEGSVSADIPYAVPCCFAIVVAPDIVWEWRSRHLLHGVLVRRARSVCFNVHATAFVEGVVLA